MPVRTGNDITHGQEVPLRPLHVYCVVVVCVCVVLFPAFFSVVVCVSVVLFPAFFSVVCVCVVLFPAFFSVLCVSLWRWTFPLRTIKSNLIHAAAEKCSPL